MTAVKSEFLKILSERGFIHQATDLEGLDAALLKGPITAYIGFDCTAPSLHVGSLVQIMMLRWLQKTGNRALPLLGDATTRIGDPTGRDESRKMLSEDDIESNLAGIRGIFEQFLDFGDRPSDAKFVRNMDWLGGVGYLDLLREVGTDFTINRMLTFDSVKLRLDREQPMTFLEFNYMILQAYDFMKLNQSEDCILQLGGSDQWGNIVNGIELTRRHNAKQVFGVTTPLITTADGGKMGKTAGGAIWLNEAMLPAYDYWQFWRNTQDADVGKFLKLFTELPLDEIAKLEALEGQEINEAKRILANEATAMCRGKQAAEDAERTAHETFVKGGAGDDLPTIEVNSARINQGLQVIDLFIEAGLGASKGEVRRLIKQGGAKINDQKVSGEDLIIGNADILDGKIKLSAGKKRHALVIPE